MSWCQKKSSSGLYGAREDNRGRHTDHPAGCHSIWTNQGPTSIISPFLQQMPFLPQPSHFILAWGTGTKLLTCIPSGIVCTQWHGSIPSGMVNTQWRGCIPSSVVKMCSIMMIITHPFVWLTKAALRTDSALLTVQVAALMDVDRLCKMMRF